MLFESILKLFNLTKIEHLFLFISSPQLLQFNFKILDMFFSLHLLILLDSRCNTDSRVET